MGDDVSNDVRLEQSVWAAPDSIQFFSGHRDRVEDLYPSERRFLPDLLPRVRSVLDIGCAAGGFSNIMKSFNPSLEDTGIDINPVFVRLAAERYPDSRFEVGDGIHFQTPAGSYELVHSSGILHLNSRYAEIVSSGYEQASRYLLCDFRLTRGDRVEGTFKVEFEPDEEPRSVLPYIVPNVDELLAMLAALSPAPSRVRLHAYYHPPSPMASIPLAQVLMTVVLVDKGDGHARTEMDLDLP